MARRKHSTPSQLALAWALAQGEDVVPIPGTKHPKYLEENVAALDVKLTAEDLIAIDKAWPLGAAAGERYSEQMKKLIDSAA